MFLYLSINLITTKEISLRVKLNDSNLYHPFLSLHRFRHWVAVASAGMVNNRVWVVASAAEAIGGVWLHFLFLFKL